jgi:transcriptional regulator with XRE-family HTH domain
MIGKYERAEALPSIEAAKKIADAFQVSLDYHVGEGHNAAFDKATVKRLQDIQKLSAEEKGTRLCHARRIPAEIQYPK